MKHSILKGLCLGLLFALPIGSGVSCREKGPAERTGEKVDDVLDQRPGEKVRDKVEDVTE
ncbi:MAG: hypothetical protein V4733_00890 [Verrucomicrobiota bacterium]